MHIYLSNAGDASDGSCHSRRHRVRIARHVERNFRARGSTRQCETIQLLDARHSNEIANAASDRWLTPKAKSIVHS
jgi:hypothetical protein